jgi:hypothetical protein
MRLCCCCVPACLSVCRAASFSGVQPTVSLSITVLPIAAHPLTTRGRRGQRQGQRQRQGRKGQSEDPTQDEAMQLFHRAGVLHPGAPPGPRAVDGPGYCPGSARSRLHGARHARQGDQCTFAHGEHEIGMLLDDDQVRATSHLGDDPSGGLGSSSVASARFWNCTSSSPLAR